MNFNAVQLTNIFFAFSDFCILIKKTADEILISFPCPCLSFVLSSFTTTSLKAFLHFLIHLMLGACRKSFESVALTSQQFWKMSQPFSSTITFFPDYPLCFWDSSESHWSYFILPKYPPFCIFIFWSLCASFWILQTYLLVHNSSAVSHLLFNPLSKFLILLQYSVLEFLFGSFYTFLFSAENFNLFLLLWM